uniref:RING-type domain-containing protein n=1 Tax=Hyaloperonospora arabidopsidis (strain Emoy2) TaxID=559515 RepID=M4BQG2_HYAAE
MTFRGVLLELNEAKSHDGFRVLAPEAELTLPPPPASPLDKSFLNKWSQQKLEIIDTLSRDLLQVTRLATVTPQAGEQSILWSGFTCSEGDIQAAGEKTDTRCCYCFHFGSEFDYELFIRTFAALKRVQQYALLQSSVVLEMAMEFEDKKWRKEEEGRLQAAVKRAQQRLELRRVKRKEEDEVKRRNEEKMKKRMREAKKTKVVAVPLPRTMRCVLCRVPRPLDAPEFPKHPFVLKDGKGEVVHICKVCLQRVLQLRLATQALVKTSREDNYCGLCAQPTDKLSVKATKACAHTICTRVYCVLCIDKLIGKAQAATVWQTKKWLCPNCTTDNTNLLAGKEGKGAGSVAAAKQKKRKRYSEIEGDSTADKDRLDLMRPSHPGSDMKPIDYAVTYFKFILKREIHDEFNESEDVCFCCKDGGNVIECDWKGLNGALARCPKVYHEDCLGYRVPEGKTWVCPRHRCQDCGDIAPYSCRFCVTSYCEVHLPKDVRRLGHATRDIATATYVMCPRCNQQAQDAVKQKKIGSELYTKLLRRRTGKQ